MNIHSDEKSVPGPRGAFAIPAPHPQLAIQVRDKTAGGAKLFAAARAWVERGYRVYVNDRADVALAVGAEGVHLPGGGLSPQDVRALGPLKIGMSIHSAQEVTAAVDFCVLSPIFESPGKGRPIGVAAIAEAAKRGVPILALGGVDASNARACLDAGAAGVAAIRAGAELARMLLP
jgi:thiamine-phosphate pyrophosphorylase